MAFVVLCVDLQRLDESKMINPNFILVFYHLPVLVKLRGTDNVISEMDDMRREAESEQAAGQMTIVQLFRDKTVRWQLISVLVLMVCQQLSGINAVRICVIINFALLRVFSR